MTSQDTQRSPPQSDKIRVLLSRLTGISSSLAARYGQGLRLDHLQSDPFNDQPPPDPFNDQPPPDPFNDQPPLNQ